MVENGVRIPSYTTVRPGFIAFLTIKEVEVVMKPTGNDRSDKLRETSTSRKNVLFLNQS